MSCEVQVIYFQILYQLKLKILLIKLKENKLLHWRVLETTAKTKTHVNEIPYIIDNCTRSFEEFLSFFVSRFFALMILSVKVQYYKD